MISGEVGHVKPMPEIFHILLEKIGRPAERCSFIDDSKPDIEQAQELGFITVLFESAEQLERELQVLHLC